MKHRIIPQKAAAFLLAALLFLSVLTGCGNDSGSAASGASSTKGLDSQLAYATAKVAVFARGEHRSFAFFADKMFSKAGAAAMMLNDQMTEEGYAKILQYLDLSSITVVDDSRSVVISYPQDEVGTPLKQIEDKKEFLDLVKNVTFKQISDPVPAEQGAYSLYAGVKRADGTGAVIIGVTTEDYADVCGDTLAQSCGNNTAILKDGAVISSTIDGVTAASTMKDLGITEDDIKAESFHLTVNGATYLCKSAEAGDYVVICGEPT